LNEFTCLLIIVFVLLTLYIVLLERKVLAAYQRRVGPTLMGRNGAAQIINDLFKMLSKEVFLIPHINTTMLPVILSFLFSTQILFSLNFVWGPNLYIVNNVDAMILYHLVLILISNIFFSMIGILSQSRYAIIGTIRGLVHVVSLDIFITLVYSTLVLASQSSNFHDFVITQNSYWYALLYAPAVASLLLILFLESKRAPFDHAETESEVVAGYSTEINGPMLLIIFIAEYAHLVISALHSVLFFFGG
jgi:NADH-quinone oxidoreductase subunit H